MRRRRSITVGTDPITILDAHTGVSVSPPFGFVAESADSTARIEALAWYDDDPIACRAAGFIDEAPATINIWIIGQSQKFTTRASATSAITSLKSFLPSVTVL